MRREWLVLAAVTLSFFFLNAATFASLGVVLFSMVGELHWSQKAAGFSFSLLGLACGLSSSIPAALMKRYGGRPTVAIGGVILAAGFGLAAVAHGLVEFYLAMLLLGLGYSLAGNVPAVYLIASWFPNRAARMIGIYLMVGAFGGVVGPPLVRAVVALSGSWRLYWAIMAAAAALIGLVGLVFIRDRKAVPAVEADPRAEPPEESGWTYREAIMTPQFMLVAASMAITMACVTTINSVAVTHLHHLGATPSAGALALSLTALVMTVAKGIAGPLCDYVSVRLLLAGGLLMQLVGVAVFAHATSALSISIFALAFGIGWGFAYLSASVLLLQYFGREIGSQVLAVVWLFSTVAAAGPLAAGAIADQTGSFSPIFYLYALLLLAVAVPIAAMDKPAALVACEPNA